MNSVFHKVAWQHFLPSGVADKANHLCRISSGISVPKLTGIDTFLATIIF